MKSIRLRLLIGGVAAAAWALTGGFGQPVRADDAMSDDARRARIETLYRDHKKDFADVQDIAPSEAMELLKAGRAVFVDVREEKEQDVSMLPGAVTDKEFLLHPERYRDKTLIGYCTISYRSGKLAEKLKARGIAMLNLQGGLLAWAHAGGKLYDRNGETRRIHVYGPQWDLAPQGYESLW
jgi:rhodanese-related sulfurtransferase